MKQVLLAMALVLIASVAASASGHEAFLPPANVSVEDVVVPEAIESVCAGRYSDAYVAAANFIRDTWGGAVLTEFSQWDFRSRGFWVGLTTGVEIMQWITENRTKQVPTDTFPFVRPCVEPFDRGWRDGRDANEHILRGE